MPKRYTFHLLNTHASEDLTLTVMTMRAEWVHGIYKTHEEETFNLLVTPDGDKVIWSKGQVVDLDTMEGDDFFVQLHNFIDEEVV